MSKRSRDNEEELSTQELINIVTEITNHEASLKEKQSFFRKKFPTFADNYPSLFEMATGPNFDFQRFTYMLNMRDAIKDNSISQYDASAKVGYHLYNAYVNKK